MRRLREGLLAQGDNPKAEMPFLDHLEELRWRILWSLLALVVGIAAGLIMVLYFNVVEILRRPAIDLFGDNFQLIVLAPEGSFFILLQLALMVGLVLASPVVIYQIWCFFSPALEDREKRAIIPALLMGLVLFIAGVALAYFIVLPLALRFFVGLLPDLLVPSYTATGYIGFVVKMLMAFGIVFELPVVVLILSVLGVITPKFLRTKRRHAFVAILVLASLISPGDMINVTLMMTVPLIALYEFSILLSVMIWRYRESRDQVADPTPPEESVATSDDAANADTTPYDHGDPARGDTDLKPDDKA